jgi:spore coat polysaccharide biosynthesis protein SpsF (cytidylyltransferase family)
VNQKGFYLVLWAEVEMDGVGADVLRAFCEEHTAAASRHVLRVTGDRGRAEFAGHMITDERRAR